MNTNMNNSERITKYIEVLDIVIELIRNNITYKGTLFEGEYAVSCLCTLVKILHKADILTVEQLNLMNHIIYENPTSKAIKERRAAIRNANQLYNDNLSYYYYSPYNFRYRLQYLIRLKSKYEQAIKCHL